MSAQFSTVVSPFRATSVNVAEHRPTSPDQARASLGRPEVCSGPGSTTNRRVWSMVLGFRPSPARATPPTSAQPDHAPMIGGTPGFLAARGNTAAAWALGEATVPLTRLPRLAACAVSARTILGTARLEIDQHGACLTQVVLGRYRFQLEPNAAMPGSLNGLAQEELCAVFSPTTGARFSCPQKRFHAIPTQP